MPILYSYLLQSETRPASLDYHTWCIYRSYRFHVAIEMGFYWISTFVSRLACWIVRAD